jgi:3-methylcrotonyl-CoA carboxylase beta subunit
MCGRPFNPTAMFAWPSARAAIMGPEQAATVLALVRGQILAAEGRPWSAQEQEAFKDPIRETYTTFQDPYNFSSNLWVDGVLDPLETRDAMGLLLDLAARTPARPTRFGVFRV